MTTYPNRFDPSYAALLAPDAPVEPPAPPDEPVRCALCAVLPWAPMVLLCPTSERGRWKIAGRFQRDGQVGPPRTLAASRDLASLEQELDRRGYTCRITWLEPSLHHGVAVYERGGAS